MERIIVAGGAMTPFNRRKDQSSWRDWAAEVFLAALDDAGLGPDDIDALVFSSESDFFTLQLNPASVLAPDLGLGGISVMRVEGGGASGHVAVQAAAMQVLSGQAARVAVIGAEPSASQLPASDVVALYGLSFDALTEGMTGVDATSLYALSAAGFMQRTGANAADFAGVAVRNRQHARHNPNAHLPLDTDIEAVLASAGHRRALSPAGLLAAVGWRGMRDSGPAGDVPSEAGSRARLAGMAMVNDTARLGLRADPSRFGAKAVAAGRALAAAGISAADIGIAEVYDSYSGAQLQALEGLGLSADVVADERAGYFAADGRLPVNLSGGLLGQGAPVGAVGVAQVLSIARQLEGRYWGLEPTRPARYGLVDTHGGIATNCAVSILEAPR